MKQPFLFLLLFLLAHTVFGQLRYTETVFETADTLKDVEFAVAEWLNNSVSLLAEYGIHSGEYKTEARPLLMDIYMPHGDTVSKRPAILFAFSGGFLKGSRHHQDMIAFCDSFARRGYVTATYDYRIGMGADVSSIFGIPFHISISQKNVTRALYRAVQDSRAALRYLKYTSDNLGIDTTKIYMVGSSAGAFIALHNLYMDKATEIPELALAEPTLGKLDTIGIQGYGGRANAIVSLWGALQTPALIENEQRPALLVHGEDDDIVYFKKGMPLKNLIPDLTALEFEIPETYGSFCIDTALNHRNIQHQTYFVPGRKHEFYGVSTGDFGDDGPNQYWDTIQYKITNFLFDIFKPEAHFEASNNERDVSFSNTSSTKYYSLWNFGDGEHSHKAAPIHTYTTSGFHTIGLTSCNENMACDTCTKTIFIDPLAINTPPKEVITLFPNPVKKYLIIKGLNQGFNFQLIDLLGRTKIYKNDYFSNSIDVSELTPGMYVLRIETNDKIIVRKFQKLN